MTTNQKQKTYYCLILDESGSMTDCAVATISSFNEQLQMIKSLDKKFPNQEFSISLTTFNHVVTLAISDKPVQDTQQLTRTDYSPDGMTALYDAIGETILRLKSRVEQEVAAGLATVVVVILTDGHENASRHFSFTGISNLIKDLEKDGNWTFSYLGATPDAVKIARSLNIKTENAMVVDKKDMGAVFAELNDSMTYYTSCKERAESPREFLRRNRKDS